MYSPTIDEPPVEARLGLEPLAGLHCLLDLALSISRRAAVFDLAMTSRVCPAHHEVRAVLLHGIGGY